MIQLEFGGKIAEKAKLTILFLIDQNYTLGAIVALLNSKQHQGYRFNWQGTNKDLRITLNDEVIWRGTTK